MARRVPRPPAQRHVRLTPLCEHCVSCGKRLWVAYHAERTLMTLRGYYRLRLVVRRCRTADCPLYHLPYRPEAEGRWALPHGEFGLDVITLIGQMRYGEHDTIPQIHHRLVQQGVQIAPRTVTDLLARYEELVALHLLDQERLQERLAQQGRVILAIDGMSPMSAMKCCRCCVIASRGRYSWRAPCSAVPKETWRLCCARLPRPCRSRLPG